MTPLDMELEMSYGHGTIEKSPSLTIDRFSIEIQST